MLYFILNDGAEIPWHIGNRKPEIWNSKERFVVQVYADLDEFNLIKEKFPECVAVEHSGNSAIWIDNTAKFIYDNL